MEIGNLDIELDEYIAEGEYSNMALIAHSSAEFVIDFIALMPGVEKPKVKSRIILHPEHAKRLLLSLGENISRYEDIFGEIKIHEMISNGLPISVNKKGEA